MVIQYLTMLARSSSIKFSYLDASKQFKMFAIFRHIVNSMTCIKYQKDLV